MESFSFDSYCITIHQFIICLFVMFEYFRAIFLLDFWLAALFSLLKGWIYLNLALLNSLELKNFSRSELTCEKINVDKSTLCID